MEDAHPDVASLEKRWDEFHIEEENQRGLIEGVNFVETKEIDKCWCLMGRLLSDREVDFEAFRNVLAALWRSAKCLFVKELGKNLYLF